MCMTFKQFLKHFIPVSYHKLDKQRKLIKEQKKSINSLEKEQKKLLARIEKLEKEQKSMSRTVAANDKRSRDAFSRAKYAKLWVDDKKRMEDHDYFSEVPENLYAQELADWYYKVKGVRLDYENPQTYNEKIQWLKVYNNTPIKTTLTDKYLVRDWVKERIGEKYLTKLLGVWDDFDDIDFDTLPDQFVLKTNHGCKMNYIVTDKSTLNISDARRKFKKWLNINYAYWWGIEPQYKNIKPRIIAEEYLKNDDEDLYDYKIWCFDGKPKYIAFIAERYTKGTRIAIYDTEWKRQDFVYEFERLEYDPEKPDNLDEMLEIAEKLCKDFCHVRVDLYRLNNGDIKFGEMTFSTSSGVSKWDPPEYDKILGDMMTLPEKSEMSF